MSVQRGNYPRGVRLQTEQGCKLTILHSQFTYCKALLGGALRADSLYESIGNSKFESCTSEAYSDEFQQVGVFVDHAGSVAIKGTTFRDNHLRLGCCYDGTNRVIVFDSKFMNGNVYYHDKYSSNTILSQCLNESSKSIDMELVPEEWWYDY